MHCNLQFTQDKVVKVPGVGFLAPCQVNPPGRQVPNSGMVLKGWRGSKQVPAIVWPHPSTASISSTRLRKSVIVGHRGHQLTVDERFCCHLRLAAAAARWRSAAGDEGGVSASQVPASQLAHSCSHSSASRLCKVCVIVVASFCYCYCYCTYCYCYCTYTSCERLPL